MSEIESDKHAPYECAEYSGRILAHYERCRKCLQPWPCDASKAEARIAQLERERDKAQDTVLQQHRRAEAAERYLGTLLAVILSDGGHRQAEVGTDQAVDEALGKYYELLARAEAAEAQVAELRAALEDQCVLIDGEYCYCISTFDGVHEGRCDAIRAALARTPANALTQQQANV